MSQELTLKVAQEFLKDNDAVGLSKFKSIADAAAESLAKHEGTLYEPRSVQKANSYQ